jgi:hypothetical protein
MHFKLSLVSEDTHQGSGNTSRTLFITASAAHNILIFPAFN